MTERQKTEILQRIADQAIPDAVDLWPSIRARLGPTTRAWNATGNTSGRIWRRRSIVAGAAAAGLALAAGGTSPWWNRPPSASAQELLDRAQAAANNASLTVATYHLRMTRQLPGKGDATVDSELWYGGKDRQRSDEQTRDADGAIISQQMVIFDGPDTWIVATDAGQTRIIHTTGTTWTDPVDAPPQTPSLGAVLARYGNPKACMTPTRQGEARVANRPAYVIVLEPRTDGQGGCTPMGEDPAVAAGPTAIPKGPAIAPEVKRGVSSPQPVGPMTAWIDEQTFLPLRTELRSPSGALLERSEVTGVEYNVAIPDSTFRYTPPPGAHVFTFTGGSGADVKKAMAEQGLLVPAKASRR